MGLKFTLYRLPSIRFFQNAGFLPFLGGLLLRFQAEIVDESKERSTDPQKAAEPAP